MLALPTGQPIEGMAQFEFPGIPARLVNDEWSKKPSIELTAVSGIDQSVNKSVTPLAVLDTYRPQVFHACD